MKAGFHRKKLVALFLLPLLLTACVTEATGGEVTRSSTPTAIATPKTTKQPSSTPKPTKTPRATHSAKPTKTPQATPSATEEKVEITYDAPLDKSKIKEAFPLPEPASASIASNSKENYNPVVFVRPRGGTGLYQAIDILGGIYRGKGLGIENFLIDGKDFPKIFAESDRDEAAANRAYELLKGSLTQALIKKGDLFDFYTADGQKTDAEIQVSKPSPSWYSLNGDYLWESNSGLFAEDGFLKIGVLSQTKHNLFPRKIKFLEEKNEYSNSNCYNFEIDLDGDGKKEQVVFSLQRPEEYTYYPNGENTPVTFARLITESGEYVLAEEKFSYLGPYESQFATKRAELPAFAKIDIVPIDIDGDGNMELAVYRANGWGGGGMVTLFRLQKDGLHTLCATYLGPYD